MEECRMKNNELIRRLEDMLFDFDYVGGCCQDEREVLKEGLDKLEKLIQDLKNE
jgi:polyhydroxyalkanoate synthesis regulator phasin